MLIQLLMHTVFSTIAEAYRQSAFDPDYDPAEAIADFNSKVRWLRGRKKKEGNL